MKALTGTIMMVLSSLFLFVSVSMAESNNRVVTSGFVATDGNTTETQGSIRYSNGLDFFAWSTQNNESSNVTEIDRGVGYSFEPTESLGVRIGFEEWAYPEFGESNKAANISFQYGALPIDLGLKVVQVLDDGGTQVTANASKSFSLWANGDASISAVPEIEVIGMSGYFGTTSWPSEVILKCNLFLTKGTFGASVFTEYHDSEMLGNKTIIGVGVAGSF